MTQEHTQDEPFVLEDLPEHVRETMRQRREQLSGNVGDLEAVVQTISRWRPGQTVRVAFRGGSDELRRQITEVASQISWHCNLHLDFGWNSATGKTRSWTEHDIQYAADIRVGFDLGGYFSLVGTDSINPRIGHPAERVGGRPHQLSLCLGGYDERLPFRWRGTVLHEFMHAVAFHHEHANFRGPCQDEFRWENDPGYSPTRDPVSGAFVADSQGKRPGIYTYLGGPPNEWSRAKVDHNLRTVREHGIVASGFDAKSVMLYRFPSLFYRTNPSPCAPVGDGQHLSSKDIAGLQFLYPADRESTESIVSAKRVLSVQLQGVDFGSEESTGPGGGAAAPIRATLTAESAMRESVYGSVLADLAPAAGSEEVSEGFFEGMPDSPTGATGGEALRALGLDARSAADLSDENFEAIIRPTGRPSLALLASGFQSAGEEPWKSLLADVERRNMLVQLGRSVGRVEVHGVQGGFLGTAWMLTGDIAVTNRHVAEVFAAPLNNRWHIFWGGGVRVDFGSAGSGLEADVAEVLYVAARHEPDLALLRLQARDGASLPPPIVLADSAPAPTALVAAIGFPGDERGVGRHKLSDLTRIFDDRYGVKRLAPGRMLDDLSPGAPFTRHDCSTLKGSSGSVLLDLTNGKAVGLHYSGRVEVANRAVRPELLKSFLDRTLAGLGAAAAPVAAPEPDDEAAPSAAELAERRGYAPDFLGADHVIPRPSVGSLAPYVVRVPGAPDDDPWSLSYLHYSVVMHAERRLALYTAVNIDGAQARRVKRGRDRWSFDPRIPAQLQSGNDLYRSNPLDRGHLVRRLDPAWGSQAEAEAGSEETFFWTNCAPQHAQLNQQTWLALEDHLLEHADNRDFRVTVFSGPVFGPDDPWYRDEWQIPRAFWKVVAMVHTDSGRLSATGYLVGQEGLIDDLEFAFGAFRTFQVPIRLIESRTKLQFLGPQDRPLSDFDPIDSQEAAGGRALSQLDDVVL